MFRFIIAFLAILVTSFHAFAQADSPEDEEALQVFYELIYRDSTAFGGLREMLPEHYATPQYLQGLSTEDLYRMSYSCRGKLSTSPYDFADSREMLMDFRREEYDVSYSTYLVWTRFGFIEIAIPIFVKVERESHPLIRGSALKDIQDVRNPIVVRNSSIVCAIFYLDGKYNRLLPDGSLRTTFRNAADALCRDVDFREEATIASGTAFAISDSSVCTAFHYAFPMSKVAFVFDYNSNNQKTDTIPAHRVYLPVDEMKSSATNLHDFKVYRLNKKLPAQFWNGVKIGTPRQADKVYMLGHPFGWPLKLSPNASIITMRNNFALTSLSKVNLNSGSPVFKEGTHELVGMLIKGGSKDFITTAAGCRTFFFEEFREQVASIFVNIQTILSQP